MKNVSLTGIDLSKESFELRMENHAGRLVKRTCVRRAKLMRTVLCLPAGSTIAMEACGSAHYWGGEFKRHGFKVLLIPPHHVRPYRRSQKNDRNDAEAICEASRRPGMHFVALKSEEQLDILMLHNVRERLMSERTALVNQMRGILFERGFVIRRGVSNFKSEVVGIIESLAAGPMKAVLEELWREFCSLEISTKRFTKEIEALSRRTEPCRKIDALPGVGELAATAAYARMGAPQNFKNGRNFSAFLGMVPRQNSTGGRDRLGSITKSGDPYLRKLLIHGARSVVRYALIRKHPSQFDLWIRELHKRRGANRTAVAVANKTARRIWAVLAGKTPQPLAA